jgi:hypothetical protein
MDWPGIELGLPGLEASTVFEDRKRVKVLLYPGPPHFWKVVGFWKVPSIAHLPFW